MAEMVRGSHGPILVIDDDDAVRAVCVELLKSRGYRTVAAAYSVPFLWALPLAIYLLTFVLCFDSDRWYRPRLFRWIMPLAWGGIVAIVSQRGYLDIRTSGDRR